VTEERSIAIALPAVGDDEWQALREPLTNGWLTQGPKVKEFETAFAARHQVAHALATTSCTTALHLALSALRIGPGDEVIVPAFTWVATANVVLYCGARPVFVDVLPDTYNIDSAAVAAAVSDRTKAVEVERSRRRCARRPCGAGCVVACPRFGPALRPAGRSV
jgi:perosamine synthetase